MRRVWRVLVLVAVLAGMLTVPLAGKAAVVYEEFVPQQASVGGVHACAVDSHGVVKCWGSNNFGQLGTGDTAGSSGPLMGAGLTAVDLGAAATAVSAGADHACALLSSGAVKCWGRNDSGQLGLGDTANRGDGPGEMGVSLPAVDLGDAATAVSVGWRHSCALLESGAVKCWGSGYCGALGLGDTSNRGDSPGEMGVNLPAVDLGETATTVFAGGGSSCALLSSGALKCWGNNESGRLGLGDTRSRGDGPGEMGVSLPAVDLGETVTSISMGHYHTCALLSSGAVKCWGSGGFLGLGDAAPRGDGPGEMGMALPAVDLAGTATALSLGDYHACALLSSGALKCWGANFWGQLGLSDRDYRGDGPGEMGVNLPAVDPGGQVTAVFAGLERTCAVLSSGAVKCWGHNNERQLGVPDPDFTENYGDEPGEMGQNLPRVDLGWWWRGPSQAVGPVTIHVQTADGAPVAGLEVTWEAGDGSAGSSTPSTTDQAGDVAFTMMTGPAIVEMEKRWTSALQGRVRAAAFVNGAPLTVVVPSLPDAFSLRVEVALPDGAPVPEAEIQANDGVGAGVDMSLLRMWAWYWISPYYHQDNHADGDGVWRPAGFPYAGSPSTADIVARFSEGGLSVSGSGSFDYQGVARVTMPPLRHVALESAQEVTVEAGGPVEVTARVLDELGDPIAGAAVSLETTTSLLGGAGAPTMPRQAQGAFGRFPCAPLLSGTTDSSGQLALRLCPTSSGVWHVDGVGLVASSPVHVTVVAAVPGAPSGVGAVSGDGGVTVSWQPPVSDGGAVITDYVIQYRPKPDLLWVTFPDGVLTVLHSEVTGLSNGTLYEFRVAAVNTVGVGEWSSLVEVTPGEVSGFLRVTTSPAVPSQILVDGVPRDTWGLTWLKLSPGSYTVSFTDVPGFSTPAPRVVTVTAGVTAATVGLFVERGWLRVTTDPPVAATISVDGVPRNDWGMWTDLAPGSYEVCFGGVAGFTAPSCQTAGVTAGLLTTITGTYS